MAELCGRKVGNRFLLWEQRFLGRGVCFLSVCKLHGALFRCYSQWRCLEASVLGLKTRTVLLSTWARTNIFLGFLLLCGAYTQGRAYLHQTWPWDCEEHDLEGHWRSIQVTTFVPLHFFVFSLVCGNSWASAPSWASQIAKCFWFITWLFWLLATGAVIVPFSISASCTDLLFLSQSDLKPWP